MIKGLYPLLKYKVDILKFAYYKNLFQKSQWWKTEDIEKFQIKQLNKILSYSYSRIPFYRKKFCGLNLSPEKIKHIQDLERFPILNKEEFKSQKEDFLNKAYTRGAVLKTTSGSTGTPLSFLISKQAQIVAEAALSRNIYFMGFESQPRTIEIASQGFIENNNKSFSTLKMFGKMLYLSPTPAFCNVNNLQSYLDEIKKFKPKIVGGAPSYLYLLANYAEENGINDIQFDVFHSKFETLFPFQKKKIEQCFNCETFNVYGANESVAHAHECNEHNGLHQYMEIGVMEVVDKEGQPVADGKRGRLIFTGIYNYAMPLIRYDIGDFGIVSQKSCSCGRGLKLIKSIEGREGGALRYGKKILFATTLCVLLPEVNNIKGLQFIQDNEDELTVNIVKKKGYNTDDTKKITSTLRNAIKKDLIINLNFVDLIKRTEGGKYPFIISRIKDPFKGLKKDE